MSWALIWGSIMRTDAVVRILAGFLKRAWASAALNRCHGYGVNWSLCLASRERERGAIEGDEAFMIVVSVYLTTLGAAQVKMPHFDTLLASNAHK